MEKAWVLPQQPLDDIDVAGDNANFHLERMDDDHIWMVLSTAQADLHGSTFIRIHLSGCSSENTNDHR